MICPSCLAEVDKFDAQFPHKDKPGYRCPLCKEPVPENYIADYQEYPPITFFLMGLPGLATDGRWKSPIHSRLDQRLEHP